MNIFFHLNISFSVSSDDNCVNTVIANKTSKADALNECKIVSENIVQQTSVRTSAMLYDRPLTNQIVRSFYKEQLGL